MGTVLWREAPCGRRVNTVPNLCSLEFALFSTPNCALVRSRTYPRMSLVTQINAVEMCYCLHLEELAVEQLVCCS